MTSLVPTALPAILPALPDMDQVLVGIQHIMEVSVAQDKKLLDIFALLATQAEQIKERDHSIIIMQSKIDSQQAVIEEIRSEQRVMTSAIASLLQSHTQDARDASPTLSPPGVREMPKLVTYAATPHNLETPSTISVPENLIPKLASNASSNTDVKPNIGATTASPNPTWAIPGFYAKTQRGRSLRRQGAFYGTPDWNAMTRISGGVPDPRTPPSSPPPSHMTQDGVAILKKAPVNQNKTQEPREKVDAVTSPTRPTAGDDKNRIPNESPRSSCKRCRDPDEPEKMANHVDISSIVHNAPDGDSSPLLSHTSSSGHCSDQDGSFQCDGPVKRRRLSQIKSPTTEPKKKRSACISPRRELN